MSINISQSINLRFLSLGLARGVDNAGTMTGKSFQINIHQALMFKAFDNKKIADMML